LIVFKKISPPDSHHLAAADGWLELGNHIEANEELEKIDPLLRIHPEVLELRWQIYAKESRWEACVQIARALTNLAPNQPDGWLHLSYSLRRAKGGGLQAAWEALLPVAEKFPAESTIPYNLACYAAQLNRLDGARDWWEKALKIAQANGGFDEIRLTALDDPDLEPLWREIREK
jgi:tetratricopeptide (TPR) repeat protein